MRKLVILLLLVCASSVHACSCVIGPIKYAFKRSAVMFVGEVTHVTAGNQFGPTLATMTVRESFKGSHRVGSEVVIRTSPWGETCGLNFEAGHYLVEATIDERGQLEASLCSHTRSLHGEQTMKEVELLRARAWWWRLPFSYPGRYPIVMWYLRHF